MKNILIFYGSYGGGHLSAAKSIYEYIRNTYPDYNVEIIDCIEYINRFLNKITTRFYSSVAKNAPKMWGKIYYNSNSGMLSKISNSTNKLMSKKLVKLIKSFNPNLIVSTHPFSSNMCSYLKKQNKIDCNLATIITDYALHNQWINYSDYTDLFFVAHEKMRTELIEKGVNRNKVFATGIPISPRFSMLYNKESIFKELNLLSNTPTILLFGGGEYGLGKNITENVFDALISNFSQFQVITIAGKNEKMKEHFESIVKKHNKENSVKVLSFTNKVPELMSICEFVVSKPGGLTTSECLANSLPMFIISPLPGQEEDNARFIESNKAGFWLKKDDNIKDSMEKFILDLDNMKNACLLLGRKNSTNEICNILIKTLKI